MFIRVRNYSPRYLSIYTLLIWLFNIFRSSLTHFLYLKILDLWWLEPGFLKWKVNVLPLELFSQDEIYWDFSPILSDSIFFDKNYFGRGWPLFWPSPATLIYFCDIFSLVIPMLGSLDISISVHILTVWGYMDPNFQLIFTLYAITHLWGSVL